MGPTDLAVHKLVAVWGNGLMLAQNILGVFGTHGGWKTTIALTPSTADILLVTNHGKIIIKYLISIFDTDLPPAQCALQRAFAHAQVPNHSYLGAITYKKQFITL